MKKLTGTVVETAKPKDRRYYLWDDRMPGFGLQVLPTGVCSWVFQYRMVNGRTRRITTGRLSESLTIDLARAQAKKLRRIVETGGDPSANRRAEREALTVQELLELYLDSEKFRQKALSTQATERGRAERHLIPTLGREIARSLTTEQVRRAHSAIVAGKTAGDIKTGPRGLARVRGGPGTARMDIRLLAVAYNWGISEGHVFENPAKGVNVGPDRSREFILESADQYRDLFEALDRFEAERRIRMSVCDAIKILALIGARRGEIAGLRWSHVNLRDGVITLPPSSHKTSRRTGKSRVIGLPSMAREIIARLSSGDPGDLVFKPAKGNGPVNLSKPWRLVLEEAGLPEGIGLHGLRHSLASVMAVSGAQAAEIMTQLGHKQLATAQKYIHWAKDERAKLAERSAAHISAAMVGSMDKPSLKVVK